MLLHVLELIYSTPFLVGAAIGLSGQRGSAYAHARWLDRHRPLPNGDHHAARKISQSWIAAMIAAAMLGYFLLTVEKTHEHCRAEHYQAAINDIPNMRGDWWTKTQANGSTS